MKITIQVESGYKWEFDVESSDTCKTIKNKLVNDSIIGYDMIGFVYDKKPFNEGMTLDDIKYVEGTVLSLYVLVKPLPEGSYRILEKKDDGSVKYELNRQYFDEEKVNKFGLNNCIELPESELPEPELPEQVINNELPESELPEQELPEQVINNELPESELPEQVINNELPEPELHEQVINNELPESELPEQELN